MFFKLYGHKFLIKAQLMTETVYKDRDPMRLYYGFRNKLTAFMALTNRFRKNCLDFLRFVFISYDFCSSMTWRSSMT